MSTMFYSLMTTPGRPGKTWIYFLKTKSEVFKQFQEFKALVETQTGRKIKVLRSDNGGEYNIGEFVYFCAEARIKREFNIPYNSQHNGCERGITYIL